MTTIALNMPGIAEMFVILGVAAAAMVAAVLMVIGKRK
jgi:hypothetical protein